MNKADLVRTCLVVNYKTTFLGVCAILTSFGVVVMAVYAGSIQLLLLALPGIFSGAGLIIAKDGTTVINTPDAPTPSATDRAYVSIDGHASRT